MSDITYFFLSIDHKKKKNQHFEIRYVYNFGKIQIIFLLYLFNRVNKFRSYT